MSHSQPIQPPLPVAGPQRSAATSIGLLAILCGGVALLNLFARQHLASTWWANFIFLAAILLLMGAWALWPDTAGRWSILAHLLLGSGVIVSVLATILLFEAIWFGWTLLLIVPSLALAGYGVVLTRRTDMPDQQAWFRTISWYGCAASLLGLILLLLRLNVLPMRQLVGSFQWWSGILLLAGAGAIWNAWQLYRRTQSRMLLTVLVLGVGGVLTCLAGVLEAANIT